MNIDSFWRIIEKTTEPRTYAAQEALILSELRKLSKDELIQFNKFVTQLYYDAYTWDLWGVAYIQHGGCSDDAFMDYRYWIVFQGEDIYETGLADPDSLADYLLEWHDEAGMEGYGYLVSKVYTEKFNSELPDTGIPYPQGDPKGKQWEEDDLNTRFPKVTRAFQPQR